MPQPPAGAGVTLRAIRTHFVPATNHKDSRIAADDGTGNRLTVSYNLALDSHGNHRAAALALLNQMPAQAAGVWHLRDYAYGNSQIWVLAPGNGF